MLDKELTERFGMAYTIDLAEVQQRVGGKGSHTNIDVELKHAGSLFTEGQEMPEEKRKEIEAKGRKELVAALTEKFNNNSHGTVVTIGWIFMDTFGISFPAS